jgi:hypothetical protein
MSEDRLILAIGRMERALARVEAAAGRAPGAAAPDDAAHRALQDKHQRLKTSVNAAITALDGIIAKG